MTSYSISDVPRYWDKGLHTVNADMLNYIIPAKHHYIQIILTTLAC